MNDNDFATFDLNSAAPHSPPPLQPPSTTTTNLHTQFKLWKTIISSIGLFPSNPTDYLGWTHPISLPSHLLQSAPHPILVLPIPYVRDIKQTLQTLRKKRKAAAPEHPTEPIPHEHALLHSALQYSAAWRWICAVPETLEEVATQEAALWDRYELKGTEANADAVLRSRILGEVEECEGIRNELMPLVELSPVESGSEGSGTVTPRMRPRPNGRRRGRVATVVVVGEGGVSGGGRDVDMLGGAWLGG